MPRLTYQARLFCFLPILIGGSFTSLAQAPEWLFSFPEVTHVSRLAVDPVQPTTMYASASTATSATLYKSTDAGLTWAKTQTPGGSIGVMAFDPHRPSSPELAGSLLGSESTPGCLEEH